jgi:glycosyltransferase involved in cell wall biosynthesis
MISYEIDIGFAIGRLISSFYQMALRLTGSARDVHFSFRSIGEKRSPHLPPGFCNLLEFDYREYSRDQDAKLADYIEHHRIHTIFALDMRVNAPWRKTARRAGARYIVSYWGAPMSSIVLWKLPLKKLEVALTAGKPDRFIFESEAMREAAVRGRGIARSSTAVVRTGVDAEKFRPYPALKESVYQTFEIPRHRRIIVYMGHLQERKGVRVLMRAACHLVAAGRDDVHVLFLGDRPNEAQVFAADWAAGKSIITFGGYRTDIPALLSGCYAGCIPSTGWDSFPMSSLEMQACGLPVIVSDCQGCPETVDRESGVVVPTGDERSLTAAIVSLVENPERRDQMSTHARARIERELTTRHQIENLVAAMRERPSGHWMGRLLFGRSLARARAYEAACEEADDRFPGLYADQLNYARKEVRRLSAKCGESVEEPTSARPARRFDVHATR